MKTPKNYLENLKENKITEEMLEHCLYSVNKRAKNKRDDIRRMYQIRFENKDKAIFRTQKEKEKFYKQKYIMLSLLQPKEIHIEVHNDKSQHYYLFYKMKGHGFHQPIKKEELTNYNNLHVKKLDDVIQTTGDDIHDLVSCQFVSKVIDLIESDNYTFIKS